MRASLLAFVFALCSVTLALAQLDHAERAAQPAANLSEEKIVAGLKEALELSTSKAIALTGKHDGFLMNDDIRILLPPKLQSVGKGMRLLGMGEQVDDLEISMNRAAEQAAPQAKPIFLAALKRITFGNARRILAGNETAATDYFRYTCSEDLSAAFTPVVHRAMERVGLLRQYAHVIKTAPGGGALASQFDLDKYVVEKTLDGIFFQLGVEESKIRKDPVAQTTELLKDVFGGR